MSRARGAGLVLLASAVAAACTGVIDPDEEFAEAAPAGIAGTGGSNLEAARGGNPVAGPGGAGGTQASGGAATSGSSGAGGAVPEDTAPPAVFCDAPKKVLMVSCGNGSCHSNENTTMGDFAHSPESAYKFVNRPSTRHAECGLIIDPKNYADSFILRKVRGEFEVPYCGERMPIGSFQITEEQIGCLASWLQQFQM
jgi:hypothetical protein